MSKKSKKTAKKKGIAKAAYYEATRATTLRNANRSTQNGDLLARASAQSLREQARQLEQNSTLANSILDTMVNYSVGPNGIGIEYQPRLSRDVEGVGKQGDIDKETAEKLSELRIEWNRRPEVTWMHEWGVAERLAARTIFRDGEIFAQELKGRVPELDHGTMVPYSLEFMEPDFVPLERGYGGLSAGLSSSGVETNRWGRPVKYWVYNQHPQGDMYDLGAFGMRPIPAYQMIHALVTKRFHQTRGVSVFAPIMGKMQDIKEAKEMELLARKVAASMTAYEYTDGTTADDTIDYDAPSKMKGGTIYRLRPGAKIGVIDTKRNSQELVAFIDDQMRDVAGGAGVSHSTISRKYDGNYSAQRQEMVESFQTYGALTGVVVSQLSDRVNRSFVQMAVLSGQITIPDYVEPSSLDNAMFIMPQQPWIDPLKEMNANKVGVELDVVSRQEIIRKRGQKPAEVKRAIQQWGSDGETADPEDDQPDTETENEQTNTEQDQSLPIWSL